MPNEPPDIHCKAFPVDLPEQQALTFGGFWSGSQYLEELQALPPLQGGLNPGGGYTFMWHSHTERELTNDDIFPGGMMTMMIIEGPNVNIDEHDFIARMIPSRTIPMKNRQSKFLHRAAAALVLATGSSAAMAYDVWLSAEAFTKTLPGDARPDVGLQPLRRELQQLRPGHVAWPSDHGAGRGDLAHDPPAQQPAGVRRRSSFPDSPPP